MKPQHESQCECVQLGVAAWLVSLVLSRCTRTHTLNLRSCATLTTMSAWPRQTRVPQLDYWSDVRSLGWYASAVMGTLCAASVRELRVQALWMRGISQLR